MELWYTSMGSFAGIFRIQYLPDTGTPEASGMAGWTTYDKTGICIRRVSERGWPVDWKNSDGAGDGLLSEDPVCAGNDG